MHLSLLALVFVRVVTAVRTFTVYNGCPFTVWPAIYTNLAAGTAVPQYQTGWQADAYTTVNFSVPDAWTSGRIWGRRDCTFPAGNTSASTCLDGGCTGGLLCDVNTGTGMPPATLAEFSLGGTTGTDFYDVSLVDGYNLPIRITPTSGCAVAECPWDLGPLCPTTLAGPFDSTGYPVGCKSACIAGVDGNPSKSPNCCSGSFNTPQTCPSSGVAFYWFFKGYCPNAYAYPFDESSGTALWTCPSNNLADYTITFCPAPDGAEPSVSPPSTSTSFAFESTTSWMSTPSSMNIMSTTTGTTQPAPGSDTLPNSSAIMTLIPKSVAAISAITFGGLIFLHSLFGI